MRFLWVLLRILLLATLCLWLAAPPPCMGGDVLCLGGEHQPRVRRRNESFSQRAVADVAQARAYLSPAVFLGTLKSVLVQRDGTVRAWFAVDATLKSPPNDTHTTAPPNVTHNTTWSGAGDRIRASRTASSRYYRTGNRDLYVPVVPAVRPRNYSDLRPLVVYRRRSARTAPNKRPEDTEVVYHRSGRCVLEVNQDNLRLGGQYVVFGVPVRTHPWPSLAASALPIANEKRILRAVRKVLCKGCAKPPSIEGLQNVVVEEGSRARLQCHLAGNPIPWVEWLKDGKKITKRGRIRVKTKRRTSRLVIRRSRLSDRGVYECRAGNVVQKEGVSARAALVVHKRKRRKNTTTTTPAPTPPSPWTTEPCPVTNFCNNGGTCVFYKDVQEFVCHCAEGFVGLTCDYKDVRVTVGEMKNLDPNHDRLLIIIVILFLVFFCLHWASLAICWLCCFRNQQTNNWGKFREMAPLRRFFKKTRYSSEDRVSVSVAMELTSSQSSANEDNKT